MAKPALTSAARRDLTMIRDWSLENYGPKLAKEFMNGFDRVFNLLHEQPYAGQVREELGSQERSFSHKPYRVLYRVLGRDVLVTRIIHQSRDVRSAYIEHQ